MAEIESLFWAEAHAIFTQRVNQSRNLEVTSLPTIPGRWSFTDESLKDQDDYSGQGWYSTLESFDGLMGAKNTRASLYHPFMRKQKSSYGQWNVWGITIVSCHIFNGLLSIGEDGFRTRRIYVFPSYLEDINIFKVSFSHSKLIDLERWIEGRPIFHVVHINHCLLSLIWKRSYQFGLQSLSWVCSC